MTQLIGPLVANYGGGVNSVAVLLWLHREGYPIKACLMSDPGHEDKRTYAYIATVMNPWLLEHKLPTITLVSRESEAGYRPRSQWKGTLGDDCLKKKMLPSVAYGLKSCSMKFKAEPSKWWLERQLWTQVAWEKGQRIVRAIGYDADENHRVKKHRHYRDSLPVDEFSDPAEAKKYKPWYPLFDAGLTREDCKKLIKEAGLPEPPKSSCTFCAHNTFEEWLRLQAEDPDAFAYAVNMSRLSADTVTSPENVGLMRRAKKEAGTMQLHVWVDRTKHLPVIQTTACAIDDDDDDENERPCECAE